MFNKHVASRPSSTNRVHKHRAAFCHHCHPAPPRHATLAYIPCSFQHRTKLPPSCHQHGAMSPAHPHGRSDRLAGPAADPLFNNHVPASSTNRLHKHTHRDAIRRLFHCHTHVTTVMRVTPLEYNMHRRKRRRRRASPPTPPCRSPNALPHPHNFTGLCAHPSSPNRFIRHRPCALLHKHMQLCTVDTRSCTVASARAWMHGHAPHVSDR